METYILATTKDLEPLLNYWFSNGGWMIAGLFHDTPDVPVTSDFKEGAGILSNEWCGQPCLLQNEYMALGRHTIKEGVNKYLGRIYTVDVSEVGEFIELRASRINTTDGIDYVIPSSIAIRSYFVEPETLLTYNTRPETKLIFKSLVKILKKGAQIVTFRGRKHLLLPDAATYPRYE